MVSPPPGLPVTGQNAGPASTFIVTAVFKCNVGILMKARHGFGFCLLEADETRTRARNRLRSKIRLIVYHYSRKGRGFLPSL